MQQDSGSGSGPVAPSLDTLMEFCGAHLRSGDAADLIEKVRATENGERLSIRVFEDLIHWSEPARGVADRGELTRPPLMDRYWYFSSSESRRQMVELMRDHLAHRGVSLLVIGDSGYEAAKELRDGDEVSLEWIDTLPKHEWSIEHRVGPNDVRHETYTGHQVDTFRSDLRRWIQEGSLTLGSNITPPEEADWLVFELVSRKGRPLGMEITVRLLS